MSKQELGNKARSGRVPLPLVEGGWTVVAHRGQTQGGPRGNTLAAFARAIELGAHMLEFDVHRTRDRVLVVNHDPRIRGRKLSGMTYSELVAWEHGRHVATVEEVLRMAVGRAMPYVEVKEAGYEAEILELVRRYYGDNQFVMKSFSDQVVSRLKVQAPEVCVGLGIGDTYYFQLLWAPMSDFWPWKRIEQTKADFLAYSCILEPFGMERKAQARGIPVVVWGLNDARRVRRYLRRSHADMLLTNIPEFLLEQRR
jgi:glycerophosphoryl diester phosphodiesterase